MRVLRIVPSLTRSASFSRPVLALGLSAFLSTVQVSYHRERGREGGGESVCGREEREGVCVGEREEGECVRDLEGDSVSYLDERSLINVFSADSLKVRLCLNHNRIIELHHIHHQTGERAVRLPWIHHTTKQLHQVILALKDHSSKSSHE